MLRCSEGGNGKRLMDRTEGYEKEVGEKKPDC